MRVNRAFIERGATKQLSYFWFPSRDRVLTNVWEMKIYNFWDAPTRQRTDGALVRLITPVYQNEGVADADRRLAEFTQAIVPVLNEFLPKQVRRLERVRPAADQTEVEVMDSADLAQPKLAFVRA